MFWNKRHWCTCYGGENGEIFLGTKWWRVDFDTWPQTVWWHVKGRLRFHLISSMLAVSVHMESRFMGNQVNLSQSFWRFNQNNSLCLCFSSRISQSMAALQTTRGDSFFRNFQANLIKILFGLSQTVGISMFGDIRTVKQITSFL